MDESKYFRVIILFIVFISLTISCYSYADGFEKTSPKLKGWEYASKLGAMGWAYSSKTEFLALPPYCKAKFSPKESGLYKKWSKIIGGNFIHIHHY